MKPLKILRGGHFCVAFEGAIKVGQIVEPTLETDLRNRKFTLDDELAGIANP
jgi:hypothetical protein